MVCLDATFLVDLLRGKAAVKPLLDEWESTNERVSIPAPALVEVASGAELEQTGKERRMLDSICACFDVLPLTSNAARQAGKIDAKLTLAGESIGVLDAMVAAVALEAQEPLVTRNGRHFRRVDALTVLGY